MWLHTAICLLRIYTIGCRLLCNILRYLRNSTPHGPHFLRQEANDIQSNRKVWRTSLKIMAIKYNLNHLIDLFYPYDCCLNQIQIIYVYLHFAFHWLLIYFFAEILKRKKLRTYYEILWNPITWADKQVGILFYGPFASPRC